MSSLAVRLLRDAEDGTVEIALAGSLDSADDTFSQTILHCEDLKGSMRNLRLDRTFHAISEGCEVVLWWDQGKGKKDLLVPLSGRGLLDFEKIGGLSNPRDGSDTSVAMLTVSRTSPGTKHIVLALEFLKKR